MGCPRRLITYQTAAQCGGQCRNMIAQHEKYGLVRGIFQALEPGIDCRGAQRFSVMHHNEPHPPAGQCQVPMKPTHLLHSHGGAIQEKEIGMPVFMNCQAIPAMMAGSCRWRITEQEGGPAQCQLDVTQAIWSREQHALGQGRLVPLGLETLPDGLLPGVRSLWFLDALVRHG